MATNIQVNNMDLLGIFGAKGTHTAAATGIESNSTDLNQLLLALADGTQLSGPIGVAATATNTDLYLIFGAPATSLPINGGAYNAAVSGGTVADNIGLQFNLPTSSTWNLTVIGNTGTGTPSPSIGTSYASGSVPSGAVSVQYALTYQAATGDTGPSSVVNDASSFTTLAANVLCSISLGGHSTGGQQSTYVLVVEFKNSGGTVISTSTCTLILKQHP